MFWAETSSQSSVRVRDMGHEESDIGLDSRTRSEVIVRELTSPRHECDRP